MPGILQNLITIFKESVVKIYSNKHFLGPSGFVCHMMIPFWPETYGRARDPLDPDDKRFELYETCGKNIFQLSSLEEADIAVYPSSPTQNPRMFAQFQEITKPKKVIAFFNDDSDAQLNYRENVYVFRTSFYKSSQRPTEFALPAWSTDHGILPVRRWTPRPTVSFCGQTSTPVYAREDALRVLEKHPDIETRFVRRHQFWAGRFSTGQQTGFGKQVRNEFITNMAEGDYVFCARGGGNFSYRIYEALMGGRIPLLLNTDCVLPYDFQVDWGYLFPIIDIKDVARLGDRLLEFHNQFKLEPQKFEERQKLLRMLWEDYISPTGFFTNLYRHFEV